MSWFQKRVDCIQAEKARIEREMAYNKALAICSALEGRLRQGTLSPSEVEQLALARCIADRYASEFAIDGW